ncbi:ribonuclease ZC3H12A [Pseudoliparis swirei]|uniref:ribonuclease ZC3H12A n=1 Tax=Pseudoliparis swirei TaxID=2059687 RepID=UPI0024BECDA6|nr:ribonuclease ZC3H12A [Pseudoliparis swirei]XP_056270405.1 ribonuclease ZC3H12A [Pseudoliparis swirei]
MNADVAFFTSVHPWIKIPNAARLNLPDSDASAWISPPALVAPNCSRPPCERMFPREPDPSPGPQHPEAQLDLFHKLGYSTAQVLAVQHMFGPNTDTDKLLGELVRIGASREAGRGPEQGPPVTTMSVLVTGGELQAVGPTMQLPLTVWSPPGREEGGVDEDALRPVVIDGSNVAMSHGNKEVFSCLGIQLAVNFFVDRGHAEITVFVPSWRKEQPRPDVPITDQHILRDLERRKILVFTPSRRVAGKRVVCNDDCFIVKLGYESDGIIVSNDMYRDLQGEKPEWKRFIEERLLMYSFVNNKFMPPDDPLGRYGPTLENFLRRFPKTAKKQPCPYGKKCTYGIKCKFHHPERAKQSNRLVADELRENAKHPSQSSARSGPLPGQSLSLLEDMAKKLTLGHESGNFKKDYKHEQLKAAHQSSKRATSRKEKAAQNPSSDHGAGRQSGSQEQLDSGLGSIDSQPTEAPWSVCDHQYGPMYGSCQHALGARQQYRPPCGCCSHGPCSRGAAPAFQHHNQHYSPGRDMTPYPPHYAAYSVDTSAYSQPADFQRSGVHGHQHHHQQRQYWSDPSGARPPGVRSSRWEPPRGTSPRDEEREVVRKKLLAIFSVQLVDEAMDSFSHLMDPQMLVAEILKLQGQNR